MIQLRLEKIKLEEERDRLRRELQTRSAGGASHGSPAKQAGMDAGAPRFVPISFSCAAVTRF